MRSNHGMIRDESFKLRHAMHSWRVDRAHWAFCFCLLPSGTQPRPPGQTQENFHGSLARPSAFCTPVCCGRRMRQSLILAILHWAHVMDEEMAVDIHRFLLPQYLPPACFGVMNETSWKHASQLDGGIDIMVQGSLIEVLVMECIFTSFKYTFTSPGIVQAARTSLTYVPSYQLILPCVSTLLQHTAKKDELYRPCYWYTGSYQ